MKNPDITIPNEFLSDMPSLGYPAIKVYMYFRLLREQSRADYPERYAWVRCGQETILSRTGIKSKSSLRVALLELAEHGWIADYTRGGFNTHGENTTNRYCIHDSKLKTTNPVLIQRFGGVVDLPENEIKKPKYIVSLRNVREDLVEGI